MKHQTFKIAVAESSIDWTGRKVTGSHFGTIDLKAGILEVENNQIRGGKFVIDTSSIKVLDVADPALNTQFAGHLASDDFFSITQYPEALFEITAVNGHHIDGNLTIKGITHPVGFDAQIHIDEKNLIATGKIVIDRTKYGIRFRSGNFFKNLGDTLIYNDFDLQVHLIATTAA